MIRRRLKEKFVEKRWFIEFRVCDSCGASCPNPESGNWDTEGWKNSSVRFQIYEMVDGEDCGRSIDLCPNCAERVMDYIETGKLLIKRVTN